MSLYKYLLPNSILYQTVLSYKIFVGLFSRAFTSKSLVKSYRCAERFCFDVNKNKLIKFSQPRSWFGILILISTTYQLSSQVLYTKDSTQLSSLKFQDKSNFYPSSISEIDTTITNFQNYFPKNTNGQLGHASRILTVDYDVKDIGFKLFDAPFQNDVITNNQVKYMQTKGPFVSLTGIAGSKSEQLFKLLCSNSFKNKLNLTLTFNRYSGIGFFTHQKSFTNNFYTSSNYSSKNNRVGYYAHALYNKLKYDENGGISNDSALLKNVFINKILLPINQKDAKREYRTTTIDINPWFRLNKKEDSSTVFSHFINYHFNYTGNYTKYTDKNSRVEKYYKQFYYDTIATKDSTHWRTIKNGLDYSLKINPINAKIKLGYQYEYTEVSQYIKIFNSNHIVNAGIYVSKNNYRGFVKANYIAVGNNKNDYLMEINNSFLLFKPKDSAKPSYHVNINASSEKRHPDYMVKSWSSNHYRWGSNFVSTEKLQSKLSLNSSDNKFEAGVVFQNTNHFIYYNQFSRPEQSPITIQNISAFIYKELLLFKHLGMNGKYNYQSSNYQAVVSIPNHIINGALYYQGNLFKKALQIQIGFNAQYFSEFYGMAYNTALNQYYVQTKNKVGNYPFIDFFLNARIDPVKIFIKIDHINQGFSGTNYSLTPGYLQNDRALKFGLNWLFFD